MTELNHNSLVVAWRDSRTLKDDINFLITEYNRLAEFILKKFPHKPGLPIDIAIRLLDKLPSLRDEQEPEYKIETVDNEITYQHELEDQLEWFKDNYLQVMEQIEKEVAPEGNL